MVASGDSDVPALGPTRIEKGEITSPADADEGKRVTIQRIRHQSDAKLCYLADIGVRPEAELMVVDIAPFGVVIVETPMGEQSFPEDIARLIEVTTTAAADGVEM